MKLLLHVPLPRGSTRGNWITALRWTQILTDLGHTVCTVDPSEYDAMIDSSYDALIALHARRSAEQIVRFRTTVPQGKIILALTGTDLHVDLNGDSPCFRSVTESMNVADRIVLLEPEGLKQLVADLHSKCVVIYQSSTLPSLQRPPPACRLQNLAVSTSQRGERSLSPQSSRRTVANLFPRTSDACWRSHHHVLAGRCFELDTKVFTL